MFRATNNKKLLCALMPLLIPAWASAADPVPTPVQPGRIEKNLTPLPKIVGEPELPAIVPRVGTQQIPADAARIRLVLNSVSLAGNSVYPEAELQEYWRDLLGTEITLADVYALAQRLTNKYREDGYILSQVLVPAQEIAQGNVRFEVVEGFIDRIAVTDEKGDSELLPYLEPLARERPVSGAALERRLLLLNDLAGYSARGYLQASKRPNATDLLVSTDKKKVSNVISAHNRVTELLGNAEVDVSLSFSDVLGQQEGMNLQVLSTDTGRLNFYSGSGELPLGTSGLKILPSISYSQSRPDVPSSGPDVPALDLKTQSTTGSLQLTYPLARSRDRNVYLRGGLQSFDTETKTGDLATDRYRLRVPFIGVALDRSDTWKGINLLDVELKRGLTALGAEDDRLNEGDNREFTKASIYAARLQSLARSWSLLVALNGQYSDDTLLSFERFGIGGQQFLRAFDPSELLGDSGVAGKVEVRYNLSFFSVEATAYGFGEYGKVWQHNVRDRDTTDDAATYGIGLRFSLFSKLNGYIELDQPVGRDVGSQSNRSLRIFGGLTAYAF